MKIVEAYCWSKAHKLKEPFSIAFMTFDDVLNIYIKLFAENGMHGLGAATPVREITGENYQGCLNVLEKNLSSELVGMDITNQDFFLKTVSELFLDFPAARTAVETAYQDLYCKILGIPLATYFGKKHESFPTSVTLGIQSLESAIEQAMRFKEQGFRVIKVKTGVSVEDDIELIKNLRDKLGKDIRLRTDANQGYDIKTLQLFFSSTKACNVDFVEQPLPADHSQQMVNLSEKIRRNCMADESLHVPKDAAELVKKPQPFGSFNIKLMKCGGLSKARQIAQIGEQAGIPIMWGCMVESVISISAALHTALSCQNTQYLDLDGSFDLLDDIAEGGFVLKDGCLSVTDDPGLGVILKDKSD